MWMFLQDEMNDETDQEKEEDEEEEITKNGKYIRCSYPKWLEFFKWLINFVPFSTQWMHEKCADDFICGEYTPKQAQVFRFYSFTTCSLYIIMHRTLCDTLRAYFHLK